MTTMTTTHWSIRYSLIVAAFSAGSMIACDTSPSSSSPTSVSSTPDASSTQQWDFVLWEGHLDRAVAAGLTSCSAPAGNGTGSCSPVVWTVLRASEFGCTLKVSFEPVFNVNTVTLVNWRAPAAGSTCTGVSGYSLHGDGRVLDPPYGSATAAGGDVTIIWNSPIGLGGGTSEWTAIRGMCSDCPRN